jgi:hypothetical protein
VKEQRGKGTERKRNREEMEQIGKGTERKRNS